MNSKTSIGWVVLGGVYVSSWLGAEGYHLPDQAYDSGATYSGTVASGNNNSANEAVSLRYPQTPSMEIVPTNADLPRFLRPPHAGNRSVPS
jgi:hypothetical protein